MTENLVVVYTTNRIYQAELLKQFLFDNGIPAFSIDKRDSNYHFGNIEVYVNRDDVIKAKILIKKFET
jgi:hypothetical protein